jgi:2-dehydropantoate 2-reductase
LDVTFLVRPKRAEQLKKTGLVIQSPFGDVTLEPTLATSADDIPACDVVLLGVKNYHLQGALPDLQKLAAKGAYILPLLNGVEHFDILAEACGRDKVLGGVVQIISTLDAEGRVVHTSPLHDISFGPLQDGQRSVCEELVAASRGANLRLHLSADIRLDIWRKYAFITAFSGVTAASRLTIDQVFDNPATANVYIHALREMAALAAAQGTKLSESFVDSTVEAGRKLPKGATSSMHQDLRKGLPLEVDSLQGAAVRLARRSGVEVPVVETLYGLLLPYAGGR